MAVLANMVLFPALTRFRFTAIKKLLTNEVFSGETILTNVFVVIQTFRLIDAMILNFEYISLV